MLQTTHIKYLIFLVISIIGGCTPDSFFEEERLKAKGVVLDGYTGEPIPGVPVRLILSTSAGSTIGIVYFGSSSESNTIFADANGHFSGYFPRTERYSIANVIVPNPHYKPEEGSFQSKGISVQAVGGKFDFPPMCTLFVYPATSIKIKIKPSAWPADCKSVIFTHYNPTYRYFNYPSPGPETTILQGDTNFLNFYLYSGKSMQIQRRFHFEDYTRSYYDTISVDSDWRKPNKEIVFE